MALNDAGSDDGDGPSNRGDGADSSAEQAGGADGAAVPAGDDRTAPVLALAGAIGFLSRLPIGRSERAWQAFRGAPWTLPVVGSLLGGLVAIPVALAVTGGLPGPTVAFIYVVAVVALTGINHADGVADLGDAAVVHGGPERRHEVLQDTELGVGGTLALAVVVAGLALAGLGLAALPIAVALALVVAAEVSAKLAMAALIALGTPAHEGFGAAVAAGRGPSSLVVALALAAPVVVVPTMASGRAGGVAVAALVAGLFVALGLWRWAARRLDGVTGDAIGGANELARVVALHAGLAAWHSWSQGVLVWTL